MITEVQVSDVLVENSRFSLEKYIFRDGGNNRILVNSFDHCGVIHPVTVYKDADGRIHLIDGKLRIAYGSRKGLKCIPAVLIGTDATIETIIELILSLKQDHIEKSMIDKTGFVSFALERGAHESWVLNHLCRTLGLKTHRSFLDDCKRIFELPLELKRFCHEKGFSMKQLLNMTSYSSALLERIMSWKPDLHFSASILDELASNLNDCLRLKDQTIDEFIAEQGIGDLLSSDKNSREKTNELRQVVREVRYPVLTDVNARMDHIVKALDLPENIRVIWDRTLENKKVEIMSVFTDIKEWSDIINHMRTEEMRKTLADMLDEL